ncbi:hypothetical protein [Scandinavium sp.]|jgi:hypothetical protein|uniref:hypothetical protein n=1 Tax=Scandinavium sp. TaxID=2830653 RepID=UPI002E2F3182|nr:hypothetical protein [Scandinavium sp.]
MGKYVINLFIKIELFVVVMLIVAKKIPFDSLVDSLTRLFNFKSASEANIMTAAFVGFNLLLTITYYGLIRKKLQPKILAD